MKNLIIMCEITIVKGGKTMTRYYNSDAIMIGTVAKKEFTDMPDKAQQFINEKYRECEVESVCFFDGNKSFKTEMKLYDKQFDDEGCYFVELLDAQNKIVLKVDREGSVSFFKRLFPN